jgi:hypothetical protein
MSVDGAQVHGNAITPSRNPSSRDPRSTRRSASSGLTVLILALVAGCGQVTAKPTDDAQLACVGETAPELCTAAATQCGELDVTDKCSEIRKVNCGACSTTGEACGGGGIANKCSAHPELKAVDGYILGTGRYSITFATNGVASSGGFCCENTIDLTRADYPQYNLVVLPEQSQIVAGQTPSLFKVDGYIVKSPMDTTKFGFRGATNGAMDGTNECCAADVAAVRAAHPMKNLAYLPFFGVPGP